MLAAHVARDLARIGFLLERHWAPYSKWLTTAFAQLTLADQGRSATRSPRRENHDRPRPAQPLRYGEKALREAMERLFTGRPIRTDGKLTKQNLWREAGVSRATMNRATAVLVHWDNHVSHSAASKHDQAQAAEIARLRRQLQDNQHERQRLQSEVDAAATVIAALIAENTALREQLAERSAVVVPLGRAHAIRD